MMKFKLMFGATSSSSSCSTPINNGRLAMVAITGMVSQNSFFGTTGPETWLPGGAFETELGVQSLWGSWTRLVCLRTMMSTPSSAAALRS